MIPINQIIRACKGAYVPEPEHDHVCFILERCVEGESTDNDRKEECTWTQRASAGAERVEG